MGPAPVTVLLDSVILIDHFNGIDAATRYLSQAGGSAAVSVITRAEVLAGFEAGAAAVAKRLLNCFPTLVIDQPVADRAAELRRRHRWKLPDAFQVAIAQHHGLHLATRNVKDFPPGRWDFVLVPYTV
jgi:predicted nucleic acid-binding protein